MRNNRTTLQAYRDESWSCSCKCALPPAMRLAETSAKACAHATHLKASRRRQHQNIWRLHRILSRKDDLADVQTASVRCVVCAHNHKEPALAVRLGAFATIIIGGRFGSPIELRASRQTFENRSLHTVQSTHNVLWIRHGMNVLFVR